MAAVPPYVLRGWEAEFPDLGYAKTAGAPRVYRKADVERVLRLKHLILVDGLTLAGARKRLIEEGAVAPPPEVVSDADVASMMNDAARTGLQDVKRGLKWIMGVLDGEGSRKGFALSPPSESPEASASGAKKPSAKAKAAASETTSRKPKGKGKK